METLNKTNMSLTRLKALLAKQTKIKNDLEQLRKELEALRSFKRTVIINPWQEDASVDGEEIPVNFLLGGDGLYLDNVCIYDALGVHEYEDVIVKKVDDYINLYDGNGEYLGFIPGIITIIKRL